MKGVLKRLLPPVLGVLAGAALGLGVALAGSGGGYDLRWQALDGGGTRAATGGAYALAATVGQPDAAIASGGAYTLRGGFLQHAEAREVYLPAVTR